MGASSQGRTTVEILLAAARARLRRLEPWEAWHSAQDDGLIVDIRSERQRQDQGLVPGAYFVPRNVLEWRADATCPHHDPTLTGAAGPLILMCAQGYQSSLAAATLQDLGIPCATDMVGGFEGWRAQGLPILPADVAPGAGSRG